MKILIALDLGECDLDSSKVIVGKYSKIDEYIELTAKELSNLKPGEIISFNEYYLKFDRENICYYEAEFHGILET